MKPWCCSTLHRFDADRQRQELLAAHRLRRDVTQMALPYEDGEKERDKHKSALELRLDVVKQIVWKQALERQVSANEAGSRTSGEIWGKQA